MKTTRKVMLTVLATAVVMSSAILPATAEGRAAGNRVQGLPAQGEIHGTMPEGQPGADQQAPQGQMPGADQQALQGQMPGVDQQAPQGQMPGADQQAPQGQMPGADQQAPQGQMPGGEQQAPQGQMPGNGGQCCQGGCGCCGGQREQNRMPHGGQFGFGGHGFGGQFGQGQMPNFGGQFGQGQMPNFGGQFGQGQMPYGNQFPQFQQPGALPKDEGVQDDEDYEEQDIADDDEDYEAEDVTDDEDAPDVDEAKPFAAAPQGQMPPQGRVADGNRGSMIDFDALVKNGTISEETRNAINDYIRDNMAEPSGQPDENGDPVEDMINALLENEIISQEEYDAILESHPDEAPQAPEAPEAPAAPEAPEAEAPEAEAQPETTAEPQE